MVKQTNRQTDINGTKRRERRERRRECKTWDKHENWQSVREQGYI